MPSIHECFPHPYPTLGPEIVNVLAIWDQGLQHRVPKEYQPTGEREYHYSGGTPTPREQKPQGVDGGALPATIL